MVTMLVDTNILVDMLRSYEPAIKWKNEQREAIIGISSVVYMEVLQGTKNTISLRKSLRFQKQFERIHITEDDQSWAIKQLVKYHLSHSIDLTDALIAAPAFRLQLPLYTRNTKHFKPMIPQLVK